MILFSIVCSSLHFVRVRSGIGRFQFLQFQLVCALRDNALAWFHAGNDRYLRTIFIADDNVAALELLAGSHDVYDFLAFVIEDGFFGYEKNGGLVPGIQPDIGLPAGPEFTGAISYFEESRRRAGLFIDNRVDVDKASTKFLLGKGRCRKHGFAFAA